MKEEFRDVKGFEGLYQISNFGNVLSLEKKCGKSQRKTKLLKKELSYVGYYRVVLYNKKNRKKICVHRLVAEAFLENPNNLPEVNHINEIKTDNRLENLEWCSCKYNCNYGTRNEKIKEKLYKKIIQYDKNMNFIKEWSGQKKASNILNIKTSCINACLNNKQNTAGGYVWRYKYEQ